MIDGQTEEHRQRGQAMDGENNMLVLLQSRQASHLESLHSNEGYLFQDGTIKLTAFMLHTEHWKTVIQIRFCFQQMLLMWSESQWKEHLIAEYNQLTLGCNPIVWKTGTCWIDQRGRVIKRSIPFPI